MKQIVVITTGIKISGNLGALARLCNNFGVSKLISVQPFCDIDQKAYERATHGKTYLDNILILNSIKEAREHTDLLIGLSSRFGSISNFSRPAISIQEVSKSINGYTGRIGILLGREDHGLNNEEVGQCDILAHISTNTSNPVLNISHAAAIALYELVRDDNYSSIEHNTHRLMHREEKEVFLKFLSEILEHSWIIDEKIEGTIRVFRTIISRAVVTNRESPSLVGTMRAIHSTIMKGHPPWDNCDVQKR